MLYPYSPLDFVEAIARERRESIRADANRIGLLRRLANALTVAGRRFLTRRPRAVPNPA